MPSCLTDAELRASPISVTMESVPGGGLTNTELRAVAVPVSIGGTVPVSGPLSDSQLRASPVPVSGTVAISGTLPVSGTVGVSGTLPVSGPLTDAQIRATALPVSGTVAVSGTVPVSAAALPLPSGAATETTLSALSAKHPATLGQKAMTASLAVVVASDQSALPVSGPLTDTQIRATALPVSGTVAVSGTSAVSAASLPLPTGASTEATLSAASAKLPATLGQKTMAASMAVVLASDQASVPVAASLSSTGNIVRMRASDLRVTATAAVNTGATCTLPAAGVGLFHYITRIELVKLYAVVGTASAAGVVVTSTNLPGSPSWTTEQAAGTLGTAPKVILEELASPLKSSVANTSTTFVAGAQAQTIWRWNVSYYTDV